MPTNRRTVYRNIDGAVFDDASQPIESAFLTRTWVDGQITRVPDISGIGSDVDVVDEPCLFGGYFFDQFGHFILESLARTWAVRELGPLPIVWAAGGPPSAWQREILELVGIGSRHIFPERPTRFRELIVPEPGFRIQGQYHPQHIRHLGRHEPARTCSWGKVWLSRSGVEPHRRSPQESRLEAALARQGWRIVHPQNHPVAEQLDMLANAEVVAGLEGSAFHAVLLLRDVSAPLIILRQTLNRNYSAIAQAKGITEIDLYGAFLIDDRFSRDLANPASTARLVGKVADELAAGNAPPAAIKERYERQYSYENWRRRQAVRILAHFRSRVRRR